jgi:hypothetical protein
MKSSKHWQKIELKNISPESSLFDIETSYYKAGVLIWHILDDRIFISEGFGIINGMSKEEMHNFELVFGRILKVR